MLFNSVAFAFFLPVVFFSFWFFFAKKKNTRYAFITTVSYLFYGWWDWRFLGLIVASTIVDYYVGLRLEEATKTDTRKKWLWVSIVFNLSLLGFFKYFNFFIDSGWQLLHSVGYTGQNAWTFSILLPVGISFYTFQTLSYSLDIYYKRLQPTRNILAFAAFVAFFPQLVAGPIERASNLLGQIIKTPKFSYPQCVQGLKLILWGLFKKLVIADAIAPIVDDIFNNYTSYPSGTLILGICLFSFQIYGDFSGYSDIAIGTAKLFGIELLSNFKFPNFARNVAEYWQRWHISLSTWFRHYLYIPLGGSKRGQLIAIRNICIVFLVSGLWHGANWTFVVWGAFHALLYIPIFLMGRNRIYMNTVVAERSWLPTPTEVLQLVSTFLLVTFSRIFFRSPSISEAFAYINRIGQFSFDSQYQHPYGYRMIDYYILLVLFVLYEFRIRRNERNPFPFRSKYVRFVAYTLVLFAILLFYDDAVDRSFIYFQF